MNLIKNKNKMERNRKIIIIAIVVVVIMIIALVFVMFKKDKAVVLPGGSVVDVNMSDVLPSAGGRQEQEPASQPAAAGVVTEKDRDQKDLQNRVKFFVAMLGSYSSDAKFRNIIDLKPIMTASMQAWADDFIKRNLSDTENKNKRVTTQVFKIEILNYAGSRAKVRAFTRREEENRVYNQEAEVELVKSGGKWLVDKVEWK